eukprot:30942-Pelagococcus_subviridis.AAC.27
MRAPAPTGDARSQRIPRRRSVKRAAADGARGSYRPHRRRRRGHPAALRRRRELAVADPRGVASRRLAHEIVSPRGAVNVRAGAFRALALALPPRARADDARQREPRRGGVVVVVVVVRGDGGAEPEPAGVAGVARLRRPGDASTRRRDGRAPGDAPSPGVERAARERARGGFVRARRRREVAGSGGVPRRRRRRRRGRGFAGRVVRVVVVVEDVVVRPRRPRRVRDRALVVREVRVVLSRFLKLPRVVLSRLRILGARRELQAEVRRRAFRRHRVASRRSFGCRCDAAPLRRRSNRIDLRATDRRSTS